MEFWRNIQQHHNAACCLVRRLWVDVLRLTANIILECMFKWKRHIAVVFLPRPHPGPSCTHAVSQPVVKNRRRLCPEAAGGVYLQGRKRTTNSRMFVACKQPLVERDKTCCRRHLEWPSLADNRCRLYISEVWMLLPLSCCHGGNM